MIILMKLSTKIILSLVFFTTVAVFIILYISIGTVKKDKMAFVFDTNSKEVFYRAQIIKNEFDKKSSAVKLKFENSNFETSDFKQTHENDNSLVYLEIFKISQGNGESLKKFTLAANQYSNLISDIFKNELLTRAISDQQSKGVSAYENYFIIWEKFNIKEDSALVVYSFKSEEIEKMKNEITDKKYIIFDSKQNILSLINTNKSEIEKLIDLFNIKYDEFFKTINSSAILKKDHQNNGWIISFAQLGFMDIYISSMQSEEKAFSFLRYIYINSSLLFLMIFSVIIVFGLLSTKLIVKRLNELTRVAEQLSLGHLDQEIKSSGSDEVGTLAKTFSIMIVKIKELISQVADKARMENELKTAQIVQSTFFSRYELDNELVRIKSKAFFASECGGDWWSFEESEDVVWIWIADATGHGAPAALLTSAIRSASFLIEKMNLTLPEVMKSLNETIFRVSNGNMALTCFLCRIDKKNKILEFANAAHNPPIWVSNKKSNDIHFLDFESKNFRRIGHKADSVYDSEKIKLESGQRFILYTDGIYEIENEKGRALKERDLVRALKEANQCEEFENFFNTFLGKMHIDREDISLKDDFSLIIIEVK